MRDIGAPHHPPRRRRDRRIEHPVRHQPGRRPDRRHRDEPARVAVVGAGVEGDRLPDREDRRQAGARLHARRDPNDITRLTPASFEPTIDYIVVKVPRWAFEKFPRADRTLTTQMKSVGEVMAIGRTFKEAFMKAFRSLELGRGNMLFAKSGGRINATAAVDGDDDDERAAAVAGRAERPADVGDLHRARARLGARGDPPPDQHRSVVPDAVQAAGRAQGAGGAGRAARHLARPDALAQARRLRRLADRQHARRRRGSGPRRRGSSRG